MTRHRNLLTERISTRFANCVRWALLAVAWLGGWSTVWGETFPYMAYVNVPQTFARSGPGQRYYPTQQLPRGYAVEVYRQDESGWCAVRPPEGSFSWLESHEIRQTEGNHAEVTGENAVAYVGSLHSPDRSAVQVLLRHGEKVELLPGVPGDARWVRIAPPSGEFRWIAASHLSQTPPVENNQAIQLTAGWSRQQVQPAAAQQASAAPPWVPQTQAPSLMPTPQALPLPKGPVQAEVVPGSPAAGELAKSPGLTPPGLFAGSVSDSQETAAHAENQPGGNAGSDPSFPDSPRVRFGASPSVLGPASDRVEELQLRLSQMVVRPREEWQFDQIQAEASSLLASSDSATDREYLRNLLDRVARFQRVQKGLPGVHAPQLTSGAVSAGQQFTGQTDHVRELAAGDLKPGDPFDRSSAGINEPRYDAVGRLKPVASQNSDAPRYALVDDKGQVVSFVTPTPDVNLRPYVGMRIGVNGSRGFMPEYRKAHVTASRVTPIEDRIRR